MSSSGWAGTKQNNRTNWFFPVALLAGGDESMALVLVPGNGAKE